MRLSIIVLGCILFTGNACKVNKNKSTGKTPAQATQTSKSIRNSSGEKSFPYQPSESKLNDLQHTWLDLKFDYDKQYVNGRAAITIRPHFYPTDSVNLDARKFILHRVARIEGKDTLTLQYRYDEAVIHIALGKKFTAVESYILWITYTARPNETDQKGSAAISDAKGLYFVNPTGKDPGKPRQIWSQGETQSNSCWFPTMDVPNQKMTQEILLTVDKKDVTLSNGELLLSKDNPDGTRTDYWKQSLPHAPYLTMIAVGNFAIVKDYWRDNMEVNYYVEPEYKPYAKLIFGNTPEMLECFSKRLGVDYPWEKFSQIVVRDFVSGAMENTTAVVHSDVLQHDARAHLDNTYENVISHELFHHWFGDLVTCESWSNVPLNESFATYGEYIWNEYKYGRMFADKEFDQVLNGYLYSNNNYDRTPIRFRYKNREDMFDAVSYQKGGRILHMLRYILGDSAFFKSLQVYLNDNKFGTVEIHNLRLAFEKVTGQDLNWFFNQWFLQPGHPSLTFDYKTDNNGKNTSVTISQTQDTVKYGIYRLPLTVDIYSGGKATRKQIIVTKSKETFHFASEGKIDLLNVDAEKVLIARIENNQTKDAHTYQFLNAPLYADKWFALRSYTGDSTAKADSNLLVMADYALNHTDFVIRGLGIEILQGATASQMKPYEFRLRNLAHSDSAASNRAAILELLRSYDPPAFETLFEEQLGDSSYNVASAALVGLNEANHNKAMEYARGMEDSPNGSTLSAVATIYSKSADSNVYVFFIPAIKKSGHYQYNILQDYWEYTMMQLPSMQIKCLTDILVYHRSTDINYYSRYINLQLAKQMQEQNHELANQLNEKLKKEKKDSEQEQHILLALHDLKEVDGLLSKFSK